MGIFLLGGESNCQLIKALRFCAKTGFKNLSQ